MTTGHWTGPSDFIRPALLLIPANACPQDITLIGVDERRRHPDLIAGRRHPEDSPRVDIHSIDVVITRSYIDGAVPDDRARKNAVARWRTPDLGAGLGVKSIKAVVEAARIDHTIRNRGAGLHPTVGRGPPKPRTGIGIKGI